MEDSILKCCCFFGHRDVYENVNESLKDEIVALINDWGVNTFYVGGDGQFDRIAAGAVRTLKKDYPQIRLYLVRPYITRELQENKEFYESDYDEIIIPEKCETAHPKAAIPIRNEYMVDHSMFVIAYIRRDYGGAAKAVQYADKKSKIIRNI